jgi:hypothetical protein
MKTLSISLCLLLAVAPVTAQQIVRSQSPNFYVPYGVRDVPVDAAAMESSSDAMRIAEPPQRGGVRPMPRPYPMRRGRHRQYGPGYGAYPGASPAFTGVMIGGLVAIGLACFAIAQGDR